MSDLKLYLREAIAPGAADLIYLSRPDGEADGKCSLQDAGPALAGVLSPSFAAAAHGHAAADISGLAAVATSGHYGDLLFRPALGSAAAFDADTDPALGSSNGKLPSQLAVKTYVDGAVSAAALPSQSGQTGKFLTTNGTAASWGTPSGSGTVSTSSRVLGRKTSGAGSTEELTLTDVLDLVGSPAQGDILFRGASGWTRLPAGTSGHFLKTLGAGVNPTWSAAASSRPLLTQLVKTSSQSVPNGTWTVINWDTAVVDDLTGFNVASPDRVVVPSGVRGVRIRVRASWGNDGAGIYRYLAVFCSRSLTALGSAVALNVAPTNNEAGGGLVTPYLGVEHGLASGDYFWLQVLHTKGSNSNFSPAGGFAQASMEAEWFL